MVAYTKGRGQVMYVSLLGVCFTVTWVCLQRKKCPQIFFVAITEIMQLFFFVFIIDCCKFFSLVLLKSLRQRGSFFCCGK